MEEAFRKSFTAEFEDINPGSREVVAVISTDAVDRDGEVLIPKGLKKKNYAGIVVDLNHNHDNPVGVCRWVKSEPSRIIAKYRVSDKTELSRDVFNLIQDGILKFHSVEGRASAASKPTGDDIKINKSWAGAKRIVREWELFGFAVCAQPVNPEAIAMLVSKGYSTQSIELFTGAPVPAIPPAAPAPVVPASVRPLTSGEAVVALSKGIDSRTGDISINRIIARCFDRAAGKLD